MKKMMSNLMLVGLLSVSANVMAAGDAVAGKVVSARCVACHGLNGEGNPAMVAPRLAGQWEVYLANSIKAYQSGARKNPLMAPMVAGLSEVDVANVAAYYASLK